MSENAFKNLINENAVMRLASAIKKFHANFDTKLFKKTVMKNLDSLELKGRVLLIKNELKFILNLPFPDVARIIKSIALSERTDRQLTGFTLWPLATYVEQEGLDHFDESMATLYALTPVFTAEFAIRPFLELYPKKTLLLLRQWAKNSDEHIRRLASEGSRPILPWGVKLRTLAANPELTYPILDLLKNDSSLYVRKSVANHLNDHSKLHAEWLLEKLNTWNLKKAHSRWIAEKAIRTLVKKGHVDALQMIGIKSHKDLTVKVELHTKKLNVGEALNYTLTLKNSGTMTLPALIDIEIGFLKKSKNQYIKVFKGRKFDVEAKSFINYKGRVPIRRVTTRKYYSGEQSFAILFNGIRSKAQTFILTDLK